MKVAVVGAGVPGPVAAHLPQRHDVTMFEAAGYAGGHTNTIRVDTPDETHYLDTPQPDVGPHRREAGEGAGRQDVDTNMDTTAIAYESFPVSAGMRAPCEPSEPGTSGYVPRTPSACQPANLQGIQRMTRCRRRDSNPRHADYDSGCPNRLSPVNTGDSGRRGPI